MKVKELILELQKYDPEKEVVGVWESIGAPVWEVFLDDNGKDVCLDVDQRF